MNNQIDNLLALYALGDLTEEETQQVEQYLATRPGARLRLEELKQLVAADLADIPPLTPPAPITETLMRRVEKDAAARQTARPPATPSLRQKLRHFWQSPLFTGLGFALAAFVAVWGLLLLQQNRSLQTEQIALVETRQTLTAELANTTSQLNAFQSENETLLSRIQQLQTENERLQVNLAAADDTQQQLAAELAQVETDYHNLLRAIETAETELITLREIEQLIESPHTHAVTLPGTETQPEAHGQLIANPEHHLALLVVSALPALPEEQEYQVLLIYDTGHDTADTFRVDPQGQNVLLIHSPTSLNRYEAIGVSIEPKGGSPQRTGDIVLLGSLVN